MCVCWCMWCMYGYVYFRWSMCCMYVYMYLCRYMCLVMHVCVYDGHICTFNWWCMWCTCVHMVHVCVSMHTFFVVHVVHVCVHGASMHKCVVVHVCVYDTHLCPFNWWCMWYTCVHVVHVCVCGASMHTYVCLVVHECKQVVFHAWKVALFMKSTLKWKAHEKHLKSESTWKAT